MFDKNINRIEHVLIGRTTQKITAAATSEKNWVMSCSIMTVQLAVKNRPIGCLLDLPVLFIFRKITPLFQGAARKNTKS